MATGTPTTSTSTINNVSFTSGYSASEIDGDSGDILYIENRTKITKNGGPNREYKTGNRILGELNAKSN